MCQERKVVSKTKNGSIILCGQCDIYHFTFGQFYLDFSESELKSFKTFLKSIDATYWEEFYSDCNIKRKIPIPTQQTNLYIMLNKFELEELKLLTSFNANKTNEITLLSLKDIDYDFIVN